MEDLYCGVCKSAPKFPMILPCCLKTVCKDHRLSNCPFCDAQLTIFNLQPNIVLMHYFNAAITQKCERCEISPSNVSCHNCRASLCKDCSTFLHSQGIYLKHSISNCSQLINNADIMDICALHKLPLNFYCEKDQQTLCRRCKDSHNTHGVHEIASVASDHVASILNKQKTLVSALKHIKKAVKQCKENSDASKENLEACESVIESKFKNLRQMLMWKEEEIMAEVKEVFRRRRMEAEILLQSLEIKQKKLNEALGFLEVAVKMQPSVILAQNKFISHILSQALSIDLGKSISPKPPDYSVKLEITACQNSIDSICLSDPDSHNSSIATHQSSTIKSPKPQYPADRTSTTPIKSRSNSRESNSLPQLDDSPLDQRMFKKKLQTATSIQVSWNHPTRPIQGLTYCLEYGVGTKLNNIEQFRQVYKGTAHTCIITDLLPKTSYRFRVSPMINEVKGEWSEIVTVTTFDSQKIDVSSFAAHANIVNRGQERLIQFDKPGVIFAVNPCSYGKHSWEVKIVGNSLFSNDGNLLRIGISAIKSKIVHGVDIDYAGSKGNVRVKVFVDVEGGTLAVVNISTGQEFCLALPEGSFVPAFQYKPSKGSTAPIKMLVEFDV